MTYQEFLSKRRHTRFSAESSVFCDLHQDLFPFQRELCLWALQRGRAAIFADCGLGKTFIQLAWARAVAQRTGGRVLILTPLSVSHQTIREGQKFGIECSRDQDAQITVTNYQKLHHFDSNHFRGVVCDESSILKNFDGATKTAITEFMKNVQYRLLSTATAAPNDFIELGTSSEALGEMGFMDMLNRFFKKQNGASTRSDEFRSGMWRFRGHAEHPFWRWVCSWARAVRKPSDLGFSDDGFDLPPLSVNQHVIQAVSKRDGWLFDMPAVNLQEQREERRRTIQERCETAANLVRHNHPAVVWCHLNDESKILRSIITDAEEVSGAESDERKEELFNAFENGEVRVLITKPTIGGFGLNWQHCSHSVYFPSHSYEQWYQCVRRFWRFGQKRPVTIDVVSTEGDALVVSNLQRKADACERMFQRLVELMNNELKIEPLNQAANKPAIPLWLQNN